MEHLRKEIDKTRKELNRDLQTIKEKEREKQKRGRKRMKQKQSDFRNNAENWGKI